ncbi:hypothetical protein C0995_005971, partial [Termitomyces sp. Mi166
VGLDKAVAAAGLGAELGTMGTVEGPATGEANTIIGLGIGLGMLEIKTMGFEVLHEGSATVAKAEKQGKLTRIGGLEGLAM